MEELKQSLSETTWQYKAKKEQMLSGWDAEWQTEAANSKEQYEERDKLVSFVEDPGCWLLQGTFRHELAYRDFEQGRLQA